jgi:DNA polymerase III epsilon subunit-like protein
VRIVKHPILDIREVSEVLYEVSGLRIPDISRMRLWLFDLEATGLDTSKERVTQIAGIPIEAGRILEDEAFVQYVHPGEGVVIPREVQELTGITLESLAGAPQFPEAWAGCIRAADRADLWLGQSVFEFDVPLLEAELSRHGLPPELPPILDSVVLATHLLGEPEGRWSTSALIERFKVDTSGLRRHNALDDVKILGRILLPMIERIRKDHDNTVVIPRESPLRIRRHPPIKS